MKWGVMHYDNGGFFQLLQILRADVFDWLSNFLPSSKYRLLFNALNNLHDPIRNQVPISCGTEFTPLVRLPGILRADTVPWVKCA